MDVLRFFPGIQAVESWDTLSFCRSGLGPQWDHSIRLKNPGTQKIRIEIILWSLPVNTEKYIEMVLKMPIKAQQVFSIYGKRDLQM